MVDNTGTFTRRLQRRAKNFEKNAGQLTSDVAQEMLIEVVLATPADTGAARSNWQVGINQAPGNELSPYAPGRKLGLGETGNANAAIAAGMSKILASTLGDTLFLVNNVPYIGKLNSGSSQQAGAGFIERAFDRARKRVQRARNLLG